MPERMTSSAKGASWDMREQHPRFRDSDATRRRNRAREKDQARHEERRDAGATPPSAVFENASDRDITIEAVWRAEDENQAGLVDFDGTYRTETEER